MSLTPNSITPATSASLEPGATEVPTASGTARCPRCGAEVIQGASFCEECSFEFGAAPTARTGSSPESVVGAGIPAASGAPSPHPSGDPTDIREEAATPITADPGDESPLDVGWTGPTVPGLARSAARAQEGGPSQQVAGAACHLCGDGHYEDGYCDTCGAKQPDPRDHFSEAPQPWVAGVCDIGRRHRRNEDAMALFADAPALSFAGLVVCDGVSNTADSHVASLAASRAACDVLRAPLPRGVGTRATTIAAAEQRLADAVEAADRAVGDITAVLGETGVANPPSCTFVAALVCRVDEQAVAVVGNVGDSRAYWLPDSADSPARQLTRDDSFAAEQMSAGVPRKEAETAAGAHAITRWLGTDSPDDLTPHTLDLDLDEDGWLLVCSDGLWNYCSEAEDLRTLVRETVDRLGPVGLHPPALAQALTDFANTAGGIDNITVTLARVGAVSEAGEPAETSRSAGVDASRVAPTHPTMTPEPAPHTDRREAP